MYERQFAERLTELRMKKGVSARDMSLSLGQNSGYINHIENRQTLPSMSVFFNICDYFSIAPSDFFHFEKNDPELMQKLNNDLMKLSTEQLRNLYTLVHSFVD